MYEELREFMKGDSEFVKELDKIANEEPSLQILSSYRNTRLYRSLKQRQQAC